MPQGGYQGYGQQAYSSGGYMNQYAPSQANAYGQMPAGGAPGSQMNSYGKLQ